MVRNESGRRAPLSLFARLFSILLLISLSSAVRAEVPIPELGLWEANMLQYGKLHCYLGTLGHTYYDGERVYEQIADYTGDPKWFTCAQLAEQVYRDQYVLTNNGRVPGYWNFTTGIRMDFERTGDGQSKNAAILLSKNAAYAVDGTPLEWTKSADYSREVAYAILSYINAEALGEPKRQRRIDLVNQAYDHMDQWFVRFAWPGPWQQSPQETGRLSPFMVGLTAHSLIRDWEETKDPRLIPALKRAADWMWANAWIPTDESMWYESPDRSTGAPDLNLLIAPVYAFLYWQTGEAQYRDQGDALFAGGVQRAYLGAGKQFNQNYWWSLDYVEWRSNGTTSPPPSSSTEPVGYWMLDDGVGTTATDSSANGHTGTLVYAPLWTAGKLDGALEFEGVTSYVNVPHDATLNAFPLSVAVWMKTDSTSGVRGVVNKYAGGSFSGWNLFLNDGNLCAWYLRDSANYVYPGGGCPFNLAGYNDGQWHHVVFVVDATGGRLYVDGTQQGSIPWTGTAGMPSTTQPVRLGHYPGAYGGAEYFQGLLDDVRIYNRTLSAAEVVTLYTAADSIPPTVSITTPTADATVSGTVTVTASATDNVGVVGVKFQLNGANLGPEDTTNSYSVFWDTTKVSNGSYILTAVARDAAGNVTTSGSVSLTVLNAPAGLTLTVTKAGTGAGAVTSGPVGINCGTQCAASFASGTMVALDAAPAAGSTFVGWSGGGCWGIGTCWVNLTAAATVTAQFDALSSSLDLRIWTR